MGKEHTYTLTVKWTDNIGHGTSDYRKYERSHTVVTPGKPDIAASSNPAFRGDEKNHNPEELFLSALSGCHMLWYLSLCANAGVVVTDYYDEAEATMVETEDGGGHFSAVTLHPHVIISDQAMVERQMLCITKPTNYVSLLIPVILK